MPHLEENLRYATTHENRCLTHLPLAEAFPVLRHPALQGCALTNETRNDDTVAYLLVCTGGHGTTGRAVWHIGEERIHGTLNVKLGGKNMTFTQRVTALPRGEKTSPESGTEQGADAIVAPVRASIRFISQMPMR